MIQQTGVVSVKNGLENHHNLNLSFHKVWVSDGNPSFKKVASLLRNSSVKSFL
jgi:hypothetical protein